MRLSGLLFAVILVAPLTVFAQHSSGGGSSSSSGSSSAGSSSAGSSSGGHSGGGSAGSGSSSGSSHSSGGGSGGGGSFHNSSSGGGHSASSSGSSHATNSSSHSSGSSAARSQTSVQPTRTGSTTASNTAKTDAARSVREPASSNTRSKENGSSLAKTAPNEKHGFFSFLRHPFHKSEPKPVEPTTDPDLRHRICLEGPCKEAPHKPVEPPTETDLRHRVCINEPCTMKCPPGQSMGKNGACSSTPVQTSNLVNNCAQGGYWNGSACATDIRCPLNMVRNGGHCEDPAGECASFSARAAMLADRVRSARAQRDSACNQGAAQDCTRFTMQYGGAVSEYRMLQNEAPAACRHLLFDPLAF